MAPANSRDSSRQYPATVEIERLGFSWHVANQFDLDRMSEDRRIQVRDSNHYEPPSLVKSIAQQMGYTVFQPVIMTEDDYTADGNTRGRARKERKERFTPAVIVEAKYENAPRDVRAKLEVLAATLNCQNGTALTVAERQKVALTAFSELDMLPEHYARGLGLKPSDVAAIKQERLARTRLARLGIEPNGHLSKPALRALGKQTAQVLNDEPFRELVLLSQDYALTVAEINDIAKAAKETQSDQGARLAIQAERQRPEMADRKIALDLTGKSQPAASGQLRRSLGFARNFHDTPGRLIETNPANVATHIAVVTEARDILDKVLELQQQQPGLPEDDAA